MQLERKFPKEMTDPHEQAPVLDAAEMKSQARRAADYLKLLANEQRLMILCMLLEGECSVGELAARLGLNQPNVSQHLAKLRALEIVEARREGAVARYRLTDETVRPIVAALYDRFCRQR